MVGLWVDGSSRHLTKKATSAVQIEIFMSVFPIDLFDFFYLSRAHLLAHRTVPFQVAKHTRDLTQLDVDWRVSGFKLRTAELQSGAYYLRHLASLLNHLTSLLSHFSSLLRATSAPPPYINSSCPPIAPSVTFLCIHLAPLLSPLSPYWATLPPY